MELYTQNMAKRNAFSEDDAMSLLKGDVNAVSQKFATQLATSKLDMSSVNGGVAVFDLFKRLNKAMLLARITEVHEKLGTFAIKIPEKSKKKTKREVSIKRELGDSEAAPTAIQMVPNMTVNAQTVIPRL